MIYDDKWKIAKPLNPFTFGFLILVTVVRTRAGGFRISIGVLGAYNGSFKALAAACNDRKYYVVSRNRHHTDMMPGLGGVL